MNNGVHRHLSGMAIPELASWLGELGYPKFRAKQVFRWVHKQTVQDFDSMTNLPKELQRELVSKFTNPLPVNLVTTRVSQDGTEKYLFALDDGCTIETVLIPDGERQTLCISSQVGCAMNCSFCATGKSGYERNLTAGEIIGQVLWVSNLLRSRDLALSNIVYMGMGEPLANYDAVLKSIRLMNDPDGLHFGARRITISTCGLVPQIKQLAQEDIQVGLAISLHAITNQTRSEIMPINRRYPLEELLPAGDYYTVQTGRRVSYEYALIRDFNDNAGQARELAKLLQGRLCHVNLIPINPVGAEERPSEEAVRLFAEIVAKAGIQVSIRKERGTDIEAACGQLRQSLLEG